MAARDPDRLYHLLPGTIRARDQEQGRPLQALAALLAAELNVVEDDIDALYENWFIETCEDWVVPYIGDLLGARALHDFGERPGALRAYVANTTGYRQAKGTAAILEQLAHDVTGWPAHAVEFFQRLIQSQHVNHVRPGNHATVGLGDVDAAAQTGRPFERSNHNVDVRSVANGRGRYNIPNVGLFVWRLQSYAMGFAFSAVDGYLGGVQPAVAAIGAGFRHLDPLGRDMAMFNRPRSEASIAALATERDVPGPLRRRPLFHDLEALRAGTPGGGLYFETPPVLTVRLDGATLAPAALHCCALDARDDGQGGTVWRRPATPGEVMFDPVLGRLSLHPDDEGKPVEVACAYGFPYDLGGGPYDRRPSVEAWLEDFTAAMGGQDLWQVGVTRRVEEISDDPQQGGPVVGSLAEAVQRWNAHATPNARGIIAIMDSASYAEALDTIAIPAGARLAIVAAGWPPRDLGAGARERLAGELAPQGQRPHVAAELRVAGTAGVEDPAGTLVLDGLLLQGEVVAAPGDLGRLEARHCTLGAAPDGLNGGIRAQTGAGGDNARLSLCIDHAVVGAISGGLLAGAVTIRDSVIGEDRSANPDPAAAPTAIDTPEGDLTLERVSVFGKTAGRTLHASDCIFTAPLDIARRQDGCVRYSFLPADSRTPRRFRCAPDLTLAREAERLERDLTDQEAAAIRARIQPAFTSRRHGDPAFAQLTPSAPPEIAAGGDGGAAMGAHAAFGEPFRIANLRNVLDEYLPLGLEAGIIFVT